MSKTLSDELEREVAEWANRDAFAYALMLGEHVAETGLCTPLEYVRAFRCAIVSAEAGKQIAEGLSGFISACAIVGGQLAARSGSAADPYPGLCWRCGGTGAIFLTIGAARHGAACPSCDGTGRQS